MFQKKTNQNPKNINPANPTTQTEASDPKKVTELMDQLIYALERINLSGYIEYLSNRKKLFWNSFYVGVFKGIGYAVGFSIIGAFLIYLLSATGLLNPEGLAVYVSQILKSLQR